MEPSQRRARLERLAEEPDPARRRLVALALLTDRLAEVGIEPILVGGAALELYTAGGYATGDVDLALPTVPAVDEAFAELGFDKVGRFWVRADLDLYFEAPAPAGLPGEDAPRTVLEIEGLRVVVIGIEDLLLDRVRAAVRWSSEEDRRWARRLALLHSDRLDWRYLSEKAGREPAERQLVEELRREAGR
jgi:predicted nucleotidyltransferase